MNPVNRGNTLSPHLIYMWYLLIPAKHILRAQIHPYTAKP